MKNTVLCRKNDKSLEEICTFSPKTNRSYKGWNDQEKKELYRNRSNKMILENARHNEGIDEKKTTYNFISQQRIDFLYNLHRAKDYNLKRLESNIYEVYL